MIIERIETYPCLHRLREPYGDANGYKKYRSCYMIKIVTCSGLEGWGECIDWLPTLEVGFRKRIIPYLIGKEATKRNKLVTVVKKWHQRAATAVSMALMEILSKSGGLPICDLYGGMWRDTIPVYASLQSYRDTPYWEQQSCKQVEQALLDGFRMAKIKIGGRTIKEDQAHVKLLMAKLDSQMSFALDANQSYDVASVGAWQQLFSEWRNLLWLEEPMPMDRLHDYVLLRSKLSIPLAGGENLLHVRDFHNLCQLGAIDIAQPDPMHEDGIDGYRHTLSTVRSFGYRVSPHVFDGALTRLYALFAQACLPAWSKMTGDEIEPVEWDIMENPFAKLIPLSPHQGMVTLPKGVGLGIEIDTDILAHYSWDGSIYQA
ncbi:mandelate racemase/muconate lactonizing enzyme family protein [Brevibacillus laterosporus]|uniref:mandelate racemase/muconate lactonizing enzyme family protein n=1 Tax=Brevibacillus laterosporus TaxID=1465 RepID=UPI0003B1EC34|nr:mandelate racemase/muconate lactonizing enzyme family protein [Brevibacillus laterosporus]ERM19325.1 isomerase [Brevibacillus laterosporus PE36]